MACATVEVMSAANQRALVPQRARRSHTKSRAGCITCKRSRKKCDESKPACLRCISTNKICEGYVENLSLTKKHAPGGFREFRYVIPGQPSDNRSCLTADENESLDFFNTQTVKLLSSSVSKQWMATLLSAQQNHDVLRRSCIALGALHAETYSLSDWGFPSDSSKWGVLSLRQHTTALRLLRHHIEAQESTVVAQLACVLLAVLASLTNRRVDFEVHLGSANRLKHDSRQSPSAAADARRMVSLMDGLLKLYGRPRRSLITFPDGELEVEKPKDMISAAQGLQAIGGGVLGFARKVVQRTLSDFEASCQKVVLHNRIKTWWASVTLIAKSKAPADTKVDLIQLGIGYIMSSVYLQACSYKTQTAFDSFLNQFSALNGLVDNYVSHSEIAGMDPAAFFSMDLGLIAALFFVCTHCRHPAVRRHALKQLYYVPRKEGMWDALIMARIASFVIEHEESRAQELGSLICDDPDLNFGIPECCRIIEIDILDGDEDDLGFGKLAVFTCAPDHLSQAPLELQMLI